MMSRYDFHSLSSHDFEELSRDLLQKEWNVHLESFKNGRDQGIDLRYTSIDSRSRIVQCKHYSQSGFNSLYRDLEKNELSKVKKLSPERYVLITSAKLSPANKKKIKHLLHPFITSDSDIYGQSDVNNLLGKFPSIERAHHKLYLTSIPVLQRVLYNAVQIQSDFEIDRIRQKLPVYVETQNLKAALDILDKEKFIIISGIPGIGKTTLAEILLYMHLEKGFAPIQIMDHIREAKDLFNRQEKQIFYYDDFLGQTLLGERLKANEDASLLNFIELVRNCSSSRLILTTREYILQNAKLQSERWAQSDVDIAKHTLKLSDYSNTQKARILYNHLYFSSLEQSYIEEILKGDFYLEIIEHDNFNPRIIEWMASLQHVQDIPFEGYADFFRTTLDEPVRLWGHAFDTQLSFRAQSLLLVIYSLGSGCSIELAREAFQSLATVRGKRYNLAGTPQDFQQSMKELEGTFTITTESTIEIHNPSVKDFLESKLLTDPEHVTDLLASVICFDQGANIWLLLSSVVCKNDFRRLLSVHQAPLLGSFKRTFQMARRVETRLSSGTVRIYQDTPMLARGTLFMEIMEKLNDESYVELSRDLIVREREQLEDDVSNWRERKELPRLVKIVASSSSLPEEKRVELLNLLFGFFEHYSRFCFDLEDAEVLSGCVDCAGDFWPDTAKELLQDALHEYIERYFEDELYQCSGSAESDQIADQLKLISQNHHVKIDGAIKTAKEHANELRHDEDRAEEEEWEGYRRMAEERAAENSEIRNLFDSLRS